MAETDILTQAIAAARRGERRRARQLLTKVLRADQKNEEAWLWMSAVVESDRERVFCLQSVVKLNPDNKVAENGLMLLGAVQAKEPPRSILADYDREPAAGAGPRGPRRLTFLRRRRTYEWAAIGGLSAALVCVVGLAWGINAVRSRSAAMSVARTTEAYVSPTPTPVPSETRTSPPSATPSVRTATPTLDPATPLAFLVGADARPTAVYFETPHGENDAYQAGLRRYRSGDWAELIRFMESALDANPGLFEAHFYIGEAYRQTGREADAVQAYDDAIGLNASFAPAYWGRGLAQASLGRISQALADLEAARENDPAWPAPYIERANLLRSRGDLEAARDELISASTVIPDDAAVRWNLARVLADLGETEAAVREIEAALAADPTVAEIYQVRGRLRLAQGQYHEARSDLGLYLAYRPGDAEGWFYRALAGAELDDQAAALADFDRALALRPDYYDALVARGRYYLRLTRYGDALEDFNAAMEQADTSEVRLGRGQAYYSEGNLGQAMADFRRAVNRDPDDYSANYWLGRALLEAELSADALPPLDTAIEVAGDDDARLAAYELRAAAYRQLGRLEEAAADLQAVLGLAAGPEGPRQTAAAQLDEVQAAQTATVVAASVTATPSPTRELTRTPTRAVTASRTPSPTRLTATPARTATVSRTP